MHVQFGTSVKFQAWKREFQRTENFFGQMRTAPERTVPREQRRRQGITLSALQAGVTLRTVRPKAYWSGKPGFECGWCPRAPGGQAHDRFCGFYKPASVSPNHCLNAGTGCHNNGQRTNNPGHRLQLIPCRPPATIPAPRAPPAGSGK